MAARVACVTVDVEMCVDADVALLHGAGVDAAVRAAHVEDLQRPVGEEGHVGVGQQRGQLLVVPATQSHKSDIEAEEND